MTQTHTPGPWVACPGNARQVYKIETNARGNQNDGYEIAALRGPDKDANARLIAAAPELYAALESLTQYVDSYRYNSAWAGRPHAIMDAARAAIARATGKGE